MPDRNLLEPNENKIKILEAIKLGKRQKNEIKDFTGLSRPTVNRHMEEMEKVGVLRFQSAYDPQEKRSKGAEIMPLGKTVLDYNKIHEKLAGEPYLSNFIPISGGTVPTSGASTPSGKLTKDELQEYQELLNKAMQKFTSDAMEKFPRLKSTEIHVIASREEEKK